MFLQMQSHRVTVRGSVAHWWCLSCRNVVTQPLSGVSTELLFFQFLEKYLTYLTRLLPFARHDMQSCIQGEEITVHINGSLLSIVVIMLASSTAIYTVCVCVFIFCPAPFFSLHVHCSTFNFVLLGILFFVRVSYRHTVVGKSKYEYVLIKSQPLPSDDSLSFFL